MNKPLLIILSGWSIKNYVWNKLKSLLDEDYKVIIMDYNSAKSIDDIKKKVISIIEKESLPSVTLLGWSLGSLIAQDIASDNLCSIEKIILISATSSFISRKKDGYSAGWNKRVLEKMKNKLTQNHDLVLHDFYKSMFSVNEIQEKYFLEFMNMYNEDKTATSIGTLILGLDYLIKKDLRDKITDIVVPTLLIHGEKDLICPLESTKYIHSKISHSKVNPIPDAGHAVFFTKPLECYNIISKFGTK